MNDNVGKKVLVLNSNILETLLENLNNKPAPPCKFFNTKSGCRFGADCRFSHTNPTEHAPPACRFFNTATGCKFGNNCRFAHTATVAPTTVTERLIYVHDFSTIVDVEQHQSIASIASNRYHEMIVTTSGALQLYASEAIERGYPFLEPLQPHKTYDLTAQNVRFKHVCTNSDIFIGVFTLCLTYDGKCYSFGANAFGQLGHGDHSDRVAPTLIRANNFDSQVLKQVCCGSGHSIFLTVEGSVWVAGLNEQGQLGLNQSLDFRCFSPVDIELHQYLKQDDRAIKVQCGHDHTLVLTAEGYVFGFGRNNRGQLGIEGTEHKIRVPTQIDLNHFIIDISTVSNHSTFVTREKRLFATGDNNYGQTPGAGPKARFVTEPVEVILTGQAIHSIDKVFTGEFTTAIVTTDNEIYYCGTDIYGLERGLHRDRGDSKSRFATYNIYYPIKLDVKDLRDKKWKIDKITAGMKHLTVLMKQRTSTKQFKKLLFASASALSDIEITSQ